MKKNIIGPFAILMFLTISGCGGNTSSSKTEDNNDSTATNSEIDDTDYGRVYFKSIYLYCDAYGNNFDEVLIRPTFTIPEVCQNEVFTYEISDESICYIENNYVYATGINGSTKVTAKSQHLRGTFIVYCENRYANSYAFATAKALASSASKTTKQGTTLFVGDSFWEFWRNQTNIDENFATAFTGYDVVNVGISGTQAREWRSLRKKIIDPYQPENVVLNIGINDIDDNNEDGESAAKYIMTLCEDIWDKNPNCHIYYCSIIRCVGYFASKWTFHSQSNEIMKENASNYEKLHYLDIMELFGDNYANYKQDDGLHLNTAGYAIFKEAIKSNVPLKSL